MSEAGSIGYAMGLLQNQRSMKDRGVLYLLIPKTTVEEVYAVLLRLQEQGVGERPGGLAPSLTAARANPKEEGLS